MNTRFLSIPLALIGGTMLLLTSLSAAAESGNPFLGSWALTIPGGAAGWLGVTEDQGKLSASILWGGGSVVPVDEVQMDGDSLVLTRLQRSQRRNPAGAAAKITSTETITASLEGDTLRLVTVKTSPDGTETNRASFTGQRTPPPPPAPDLSAIRFGAPIKLFNGRNLDGWKLTVEGAENGWSAKDGVLTNDPAQEPGQPRKHYGNLRTDKEFEDFRLTLETNVPPGGNSGIYLRGIYEVQVVDSYGRAVDSHNMGAIYSRITPLEAAEKPAGQWQTLDITLVKRHVTVILNGKKIIDNQPLLGCTGGALWSDPFRPGPIYLQGDHTGANYRNIVLEPVVD
ncbi:MAG: DUF1080 domain-containing protein [Planctomycetes bacterium]|nr:DUF1080 domain-containing protein [Planctomycetota bacterium]